MDGFYSEHECKLADLEVICAQKTDAGSASRSIEIVHDIPVYEASSVEQDRSGLMAEWARILSDGAGVLVIKGACPDLSALDAASAVFNEIIAEEGEAGSDHFAAAGHNARIWNSLQKLCLRAPDVFARYHAAPAIDAACEAWLGPHYQMTCQVNLVRPGGAPQQAHRDYHLGFQTPETLTQYPAHMHHLSPYLTLQGAVAHCDMPVESGPTKLLPFSQRYGAGYAAYRRDDFRNFFEAHHVQVPLEKGDGLFFNPALFHAAGANTSNDIQRMANLMQIGSSMGRTLEAVDRIAMCRALYPVISEATGAERDAVIAACAEGYSFPTNLDSDPPQGGLAPETQAALFHRALDSGMSLAAFSDALDAQAARKLA